jgi:hypothetical protein
MAAVAMSVEWLETGTGESTDLIFETRFLENTGAFGYVFGNLKMV